MKSIQAKSTLSANITFLTRQVVYAFLAGLILGGAALGFIDAYAKKPLFSNAQAAGPTFTTTSSTSVTDEAAKKKAQAEMEKQVKAEYDKVYAAEKKKGTPDAKAKQIAQAAADQKRAELTTLAAAATAVATAQKERAEYVARSYDGVDWEGTLSIKNPSGLNDVSELVTKLINWTLMIIAMVATIVIIISGIMLVFNGGNETTVKKSKTTILWAIVGLVVSVGAFAMVNIVQSLL